MSRAMKRASSLGLIMNHAGAAPWSRWFVFGGFFAGGDAAEQRVDSVCVTFYALAGVTMFLTLD